MGKKLHQQRRGKGSNAYSKLPNTFDIDVAYTSDRKSNMVGEVIGIFNHTGHTAPLMEVLYGNFSKGYLLAPEGIKIGDKIQINATSFGLGTVAELSRIPDGTPIYNIEASPGDGGKYVRAAGSAGLLVSHDGASATVQLPSKAAIIVSSACRAQLGIVAGGGMDEAPLVKAGKNFYINHAINKKWPGSRGVKSNPVDHPFGGKQHHKGKSSMTSRNAPPGRKVGHIAARRVGRRKK